jgi:DNA-binding response OmpR family regulator
VPAGTSATRQFARPRLRRRERDAHALCGYWKQVDERLDILRYRIVALDRVRHVASANDRPLDLTPKEFQLLEYFLLHAEEVVRRTTLLEKVWDMRFDPESNVIDVHIKNLRRKLREATGEPLLVSIRGVGFRLGRRDASKAIQ